MNSSNPGAEKMKIALIASVPMLVTEIQVFAGMNTVAPPSTSLTVSPNPPAFFHSERENLVGSWLSVSLYLSARRQVLGSEDKL